MLLSLPLLIALFRKLRALCMLLSEMSVTRSAGGENVSALRSIVANTILAAGLCGPGAPSRASQLRHSSLLEIAYRAGTHRHRNGRPSAALFTRLYSKAQFALQETLSQPPAAHREPSAHSLPAILREAQLRTVRVPEKAGAAGKLIGELALRTRTGASIVGIQRDETSLINPGPDEELRAGDDVLLLGSQAHLDSAQKLLNDGPRA